MSTNRNKINIKLFNIILFSLLLIFLYSTSAFAEAKGLCPLPKEYKVMQEGTDTDNVGGVANNMGDSLHKKNVDDPQPSGNCSFTADEDEEKQYNFKCKGEGGDITVDKLKVGDMDDTTKQAQFEWQPKHDSEHNPPMETGQDGKPLMVGHYKIKGPKQEGHEWDTPGWKIEKIAYAYHMDSPQKYGDTGQMGYNPFESKSGGSYPPNNVAEPAATKFAYFVPSVPLNYVVSSALTLQWKWESQLTHTWELVGTHIPFPNQTNPDPPCTICQRKFSDRDDKKANKMSVSRTWHPKEICDGIEDTGVATGRLDTSGKYLDNSGVGNSKVYMSPDKTFDEPSWMCVVARASVKVKDLYNIAHIQTGLEGDNTNLLTAECGKKVSAVTGDGKNIIIRIVDNAVHATKATMDAGETSSPKGDWDSGNFKVAVWFEIPLYQYASFLSETWKDPSGVEKNYYDIAYSPMFVWKRHKKWDSLVDFLSGATSTTYGSDSVDDRSATDKDVTINPKIVVYEKKIPVKEFFKGDDGSEEEYIPWHYAKTSIGDSLGNPAYKDTVQNDMYKDGLNGKATPQIFKTCVPINYTKGKGPLKFFVEAHDGSTKTTGSGKTNEEKALDASGTYVVPNVYTQGELRYNPEVNKYVAYSKSSDTIKLGPADEDPTKKADYCLSESYEYNKDDIQVGWKRCPAIKDNSVNKNIADADKLDYFQAWGMVEIKDTIKPNVGLRIFDTVRGTVRKVFKLNDLSRLKCYKDLVSGDGKEWQLVNNGAKYNYEIINSKNPPRVPFSLNDASEELWEFEKVDLLTASSPDSGKIWEGRDYEDPKADLADATNDSLDPYGTAENTKLEMTHQDLRNVDNKTFTVDFYAHDNVDGQRVPAAGVTADAAFWYKGLRAVDFDSGTDKPETFNENMINKGYSSWVIVDKTYPEANVDVFKKIYMNDGKYFKYPELVFNNPNCKWTGADLPNGKKEISVAYAVRDEEGNKRKFKLHFYVAPLDMSINTIEKREKKTGY